MDAHERTMIVALVLAMFGGAEGCAPWNVLKPSIPDVRPLRKERAADVVASFERHRDAAEFSAAQSFFRQGNHKQCLSTLEALVRRNPAHDEGRTLLLQMLLIDGHLERAESLADESRDYNTAPIWHARGLAYDAVGRHDDAWKCLEQAVKLEPRNEEYLASLQAAEQSAPALATSLEVETPAPVMAPECMLLTAEVCLALGRVEDARRRIESLAEGDEFAEDVETLLSRIAAVGKSSLALGRPRAKTRIEATTSALDDSPPTVTIVRTSTAAESNNAAASVDGCLHQAGQALAEGHADTAAVFLRKARELAPRDESVALSTSVLPLRHEEYELSRELTEEALSRFPRHAPLYRVLGTAQYRLGRFSAARDALQHAIALDNRDGLSYFLMGCTLNKLGQSDQAQPYFRQAQQLDARYEHGLVRR